MAREGCAKVVTRDRAERPAAPNLRTEQKRHTRRALLDQGRHLFVARGYPNVTIDDITRAVGCSRATFYLHFKNKMDVLASISAETIEYRAKEVYRDLDTVLLTGERAEFVAWVSRALHWFYRNREILPTWDQALAAEPEFQAIGRHAIQELTDAMPRYLDRWPKARQDEARFRVELLVTQLERYFTRAEVQGTIDYSGDTSEHSVAEVLADIWFPALQPPTEE